jgi:HAD superfamily phosphoserine phosphatase-like hydrolase
MSRNTDPLPDALKTGTPLFSTVIFDADSTLAAIEGIDWLGALRGADVGLSVQQLTDRAMMGELALEDVYAARLDVIKPTREEINNLSNAYISSIEPDAADVIAELHRAGVRVVIVSGGLRAALLPLAKLLGVSASSVYAVDLLHDAAGNYVSLAPEQPLSRQDGKPRVVRGLSLSSRSAMVGDGSTDAAVRDETDMFIAYTRVARRLPVVALAHAEARDFRELRSLLFEGGT